MLHIDHVRFSMIGTEPAFTLASDIEDWLFLAPGVLACFTLHIDHVRFSMIGTEPALTLASDIEDWSFLAPGVLACFILHIDHVRFLMRGTVDAERFTVGIETGTDSAISASILWVAAGLSARVAEGVHLASVHEPHHRHCVPAPPASSYVLLGR
jgi:hypothetical protein